MSTAAAGFGALASAPLRLYISGYTPSSGGHGPGITVFDRPAANAPWKAVQVVEADDPSFLMVAEGAVHATSETIEGRVVSWTVAAGELVPSSIAASGGAAACHLIVDPASGALVVANYTAGTVGVLSSDPLDPARVTRVLALPVGRGPVADRQEHAHAHNVLPTSWGTVLVSDLGADRLHEVRIDPVTLDPAIVDTHFLPAGSGPRHLAWFGAQLLVAGELDGHLHVLSRDELTGRFTVDYSVAAYDPTSAGAEALLSHVAVADGRVYVAVRGRDTIAVLAPTAGAGAGLAAAAAADGAAPAAAPASAAALPAGGLGASSTAGAQLALIAEVASGGVWPRHFALTPDAIYVANQFSDTVTVLPLDRATGIPGSPILQIEVGTPSCVVLV